MVNRIQKRAGCAEKGWNTMRIVVTGATSFLGSALVRRLLSDGHTVCAVIRPGSVNRGNLPQGVGRLSVIECDLQDLERLSDAVKEPCDGFVHLGWGGSGSGCRNQEDLQSASVKAAMKALEGARALGCRRFLFGGSQAEYGMCTGPMREESVCAPTSAYGRAKLEVYRQASVQCRQWREAKAADMEYVHVRIFSVYGPGDHPWTLVNSCLETFSSGGHMELSPCTQLWNFLYIDDLADGLERLITHPGRLCADGLYNVAGDASQTRPLREYVEEMYRICGEKGSFSYGKRPPNAEGLVNLIPDIRRMQEGLDWHPGVAFSEGICRILEENKGKNGRRT